MKRNRLTYLALFAIVFIAFGCKKLEPPVVPDDAPDFALDFFIGSQDTSFAAGVNDYYMFSDFEKSSEGLHAFTGELRNINCEEDCPNSLKIKIYDFEFAPNSSIDINESISSNIDYEFAIAGEEEDTTYVMNFIPDLPVEATGNYEHIWTIDNETFAQETVEISKEDPFLADACLEIVDASNMCSGNICKDIRFNQNFEGECFAQLIIADTLLGLDSVRLTVETSDGLLPNDILWSTGETTDTIGVNTLGAYSFTGNSSTCPIVGAGQLNGNLTQPQNAFFCTPDFQTTFDREIMPIAEALIAKVVIEYIDENGIFYSSLNNLGGGFSNFRVNSIAPYDRNERDQATVILSINFSTTVVSEEGFALEIVEGQGTIGVAYPD